MNLRIIRKDDASDSHRTLAATGLSPPPPKKKMAKPPLPNGVSNMESVLGGGRAVVAFVTTIRLNELLSK